MKVNFSHTIFVLPLAALILISSCATTGQGAANGAYFGGVLGSAVGALTGGHRGHFAGTIVGTIIGGAAGAAVGAHNERQRVEHRGAVAANQNARRPSGINNRNSEYSRDDYQEYASSPLTIRNLRFVGDDGNNVINRGENCKIIFELANNTGRVINDIIPDIFEVNGNSHLTISPATRIESLRSGDAIRYTANVRADKRMKEGTAYFRIMVSTEGSEFVPLRDFSIEMKK